MRVRTSRGVGLLVLAGLAGLAGLTADASARRRSSHKNPHAEISAVAQVSTAPKRTTHSNGRSYEEFEVRLLSVEPAEPPRGDFRFEMDRPVRVVHDLTCGGAWVEAREGDRVDLRGEYVHTPDGRDLVHFTHPAGAVAGCGTGGSHPDGYLRLHREAAAAGAMPAESKPAATSAPSTPAGAVAASGIPEASVASFHRTLLPILSTRCSPCHVPGGKMYGRLPFDDPATVASHVDRMATRLKGEDLKALRAWAEEVAASTPR